MAKAHVQVLIDAISRWGVLLNRAAPGRASRRSDRAMLSGSSSLISTNSSPWILLTSLAGTGGKLLASENAGGLPVSALLAEMAGAMTDVTAVVGRLVEGMVSMGAAVPNGGRSGRWLSEEGMWPTPMGRGPTEGAGKKKRLSGE